MSIPGMSSAAGGSAALSSLSRSGGVGGAMGKEDFLRLLTTQLANQDPMDPSDPSEFVAQLAQFTSLEQLSGIRDGLGTMALTQTSATHAQMVQFVGKDISFQDNSFHWDRKTPTTELEFSLDGDAQGVSVLVQDENGKSVRTIEIGQRASGKNKVVFDGLDDNGNPLDTGNYTFTVTAVDANESPVKATTRATGRVTSVTFEAGYPELILTDGRRVDLGKVLEVKKPSSDVLPAGAKPAAEDDKGTEHSPIDKD